MASRVVFQSHAGSIEAFVRLGQVVQLTTFQSHAGSIEARPKMGCGKFSTVFQSHAGSIEASLLLGPLAYYIVRFNPTLVRLRHPGGDGGPLPDGEFQSHAGSIEACPHRTENPPSCLVSIPRWFD